MTINSVTLAFEPAEYVTVTLFDLKYHGRVLRAFVGCGDTQYEVQYADDKGDLRTGCFFSDELTERKP